MEFRTPMAPPAKTTCGAVPGLWHGLYRLTKVCAAPPPFECGDDGAVGVYDEKLVAEILLRAVAALKSAYVKLQRAHLPYDPAKIAVADEVIDSELHSVAALERLCRGIRGGVGVGKLIDERWSLVQRLEGETRKRESDIVALRRELEGLRRASSRLGKQIKMSKASVRRSKIPVTPGPLMTKSPAAFFEELFMAAATAVQGFAELISTTSTLTATASSSDRCARNAYEQCRGRYSLEAHLWRTMLGAGGGGGRAGSREEEKEEAVFDDARFDRIMWHRDPLDALAEHPSSGLARFCRSRYLAAVPPETEGAMFGNLDQRAFVSRGGHPRTWFYRAFAKTARAAWALRRVTTATAARGCFGTDSNAETRMFYTRGGSRYSAEHMRSVAAVGSGEDERLSVVAFTVAPGLSVGGVVAVTCRVFLCDSADGARRCSVTNQCERNVLDVDAN